VVDLARNGARAGRRRGDEGHRPGHATVVRGTHGSEASAPGLPAEPPHIVTLELDGFVPAFLARAADAATFRTMLAEAVPSRTADDALLLYLPIHRVVPLAVAEAVCHTLGEPPVDPARIASAGLVVRAVIGGVEHRWVTRDGVAIGWVPHPAADGDDAASYEPDPARRAKRRTDPVLRSLAVGWFEADDGLAEATAPAFVAPPAVGRALGRTLLYGTIPTASTETRAPDASPPFDAAFLAGAIPPWLRAAPKSLPPTGATVQLTSGGQPIPDNALPANAATLRRDLSWLFGGTGLEGPPPTGTADTRPAGVRALRAELARHRVGYDDDNDGFVDREEALTTFLDRAREALLERQHTSLRLPDRWPAIGAADAVIQRAIVACFTERWQAMSPRVGRYEGRDVRYVVRMFVRVRGDCGCAERTRWSRPTPRCAIAPWFDGPSRPPVRIDLPGLGDLRRLLPNVAFSVPPDLRGVLDGLDMKGLTDGKKGSSYGEWGTICSFSLPILTLCAFIVLSIFLSLLNIAFWWLAWVKICIPYPKQS
jgi:hypothetical protein